MSKAFRNFHDKPWAHVAMDKQELASELDNYWVPKVCHAAAEGLELQCSRKY